MFICSTPPPLPFTPPPSFHSSVPRPLFLSFLFRPADWCLFLSSISVLLLVFPFSSTPPPPQGSCSNSVPLHQPTFLLPLIGLYTFLGCRDVSAHLLHLQTNASFFFFFSFLELLLKAFLQNCHEKKITITLEDLEGLLGSGFRRYL